MEQLIQSLDFRNVNFYNDYVQNNSDKFRKLIYNSDDLKFGDVLKLMNVLLARLDAAYKYFGPKGDCSDVDAVYRLMFRDIFDRVKDGESEPKSKDELKSLIKFLKNVTLLTKSTEFQADMFCMLIKLFQNEKYLSKFDLEMYDLLFDAMKLKINFEPATENDDDAAAARGVSLRNKERIFSLIRFPIEDFIKSLSQEQFTKVLVQLQHFYEFCVVNSSIAYFSDTPHKFIADSMIRTLGYFKIPIKDCMYFNLPSMANSKPRVVEFLNFYRSAFINDSNISDSILYTLSLQLKRMFEFNDPTNGYKIFDENWHQLLECVFEAFVKVTSNEYRYALTGHGFDMKTIGESTKIPKQFNELLFNKTIECTQYLNDNWKTIDEKSSKKPESCLDLFYRFLRPYLSYICQCVKDIKSFLKPCMILLVSLSNNLNSSGYLSILSELLYKDQFYVLKDYTNETKLILNNLLDASYEFKKAQKIEGEQLRQRYDLLSKCYGYLKEKITKFPEVVEAVQECLFDKYICNPVEMNITGKEFYRLLNSPFGSIVNLNQVLNGNSRNERRLAHLVNLISGSDIFDSIQPSQIDQYSSTLRFYEDFFLSLGEMLKKRGPLSTELTDAICKVIDSCIEADCFVDPFESKKLTVNFLIVERLSYSFEMPNGDEKLINKLLATWIYMYELNNEDIQKKFFDKLHYLSLNNKKALPAISDKLWAYLMDNIGNYYLINALQSVLPDCASNFIQKYSQIYTNRVLAEFDKSFSQNIGLMLELIKVCPEYFLNVVNGRLILVEFIQKSKASEQKYLVVTSLTLVSSFCAQLDGIKTLDDRIFENLFVHRKDFWLILFETLENKKGQKLTTIIAQNYKVEYYVPLVCMIYFKLVKGILKKGNNFKDVKLLIDELLEIFWNIETDETVMVFSTIKSIGDYENKRCLNVLIGYKKTFLDIKAKYPKNTKNIEVLNAIDDLLENRNLETFSNKLEENKQDINQINVNLLEKDKKIQGLDKNVKQHELKIVNLKKNVNDLDERVSTIDERVDEQGRKIDEIDKKTLLNIPLWCTDIKNSIQNNNQDWILIAKRLNFSDNDIKGWLNQVDPFMSMLQEWFIVNKTSDAINGLKKVFNELGNAECVQIIQNNLDKIEKESKDLFKDYNIDQFLATNPAQVFISYEMSCRDKAKLLKKYLQNELNKEFISAAPDKKDPSKKINIWFDDGNMGGGVERSKRIDLGLRVCNVLVCFITAKTGKDQTCLNQINLAIQLNKPIIPLLIDSTLKWPPAGSLGPILSEYLFIRFFQRPKEVTNDERYWPVDKFNELTMQLNQLIPFSINRQPDQTSLNTNTKPDNELPEIFISYQWDKQKQIKQLYDKFTNMGFKCWLDIYQMGGGDSLYFKIDDGIRNCSVVISCVTTKYALSANCRKEIALSDSVQKPIIPILIEKQFKYPPAGPMGPVLGVLKYIDFTNNIASNDDILWEGSAFEELIESMRPHLSQKTIDTVTSRACIIS